MKSAIWWIRRDLRLSDNQALASALDQADVVYPVYILDPNLLASPYAGQKRLAFLLDGLRALGEDLRGRGSSLFVQQGDPLEVLTRVQRTAGAEAIFAEADYSPYARWRDGRVGRELPLTLTDGITVHSPQTLHKPDGEPYTVFTPFSRMWRSLPFPGRPIPPPGRFTTPPPLPSLEVPGIPSHPSGSAFPAGEAEAEQRLVAFIDSKINFYAGDRNRMDLVSTSGLSPYLRFGMLSARQAAWSARQAEAQARDAVAQKGAETWLNELIWREFYFSILNYFPFVRQTAFRPELRLLSWRDDPAGFASWSEGCTGYPIVDAAMRQLNTTGWMHNRARMIVASFLTKDLMIDWRLGEHYFMQHLLDGDPAANNGGWQWIAGTGTDAAPYFRIFNPILQSKKFDPQGNFLRSWVPELAAVPDRFIHTPWEMPTDIQRRVGCLIGKDYPQPIVDHSMARQRVLAAYRRR